MQISTTTRRFLKISLLIVVAGVLGYAGLHTWFHRYLRSDAFRQRIEAAVSSELKANTTFSALQFADTTVFALEGRAAGRDGAVFQQAAADSIRAHFDVRGVLERKWMIDRITVDRLEVVLGPDRPGGPSLPIERSPASGGAKGKGWIPTDVEIRRTSIQELHLTWPEGGLRQVRAELMPKDGGTQVQLERGVLRHGTYPAARLEAANLHSRKQRLTITEAILIPDGGGRVSASGDVDFDDRADLLFNIERVPLSPFLTGDWRLRLFGEANGEVRYQRSLAGEPSPVISGSVALQRAQLLAMPVLDKVALFTRTQQFRTLALSTAQGRFVHRDGGLQVSDVVLESAGLLRVEGGCRIANGQIDGTFRVGVSPSTLAWLPASRERVFTETSNGYATTVVRLTGPVSSPNEDLTPRLVAAMQDEVIEGAERTIRDAAGQAIDRLKPLIQGR